MDVRPAPRRRWTTSAPYVEQRVPAVAEQKGLDFASSCADGLPDADRHRRAAAAAGAEEPALQRGEVHRDRAASRCDRAAPRTTAVRHADPERAEHGVAFAVTDTGIGVPTEKLKLDLRGVPAGATARPAASTAAPASACRSAARSPACSAATSRVDSEAGEGSTFTLYVPGDRPVRRRSDRRLRPMRSRRGGARTPAILAGARAEPAADRRRPMTRSRARSAGRRRRRAQRLRADQCARAARHVRALRRQRRARHPPAERAPRGRPRPDGRHDAGHGRQRDDGARSARCPSSPTCRSCS